MSDAGWVRLFRALAVTNWVLLAISVVCIPVALAFGPWTAAIKFVLATVPSAGGAVVARAMAASIRKDGDA